MKLQTSEVAEGCVIGLKINNQTNKEIAMEQGRREEKEFKNNLWKLEHSSKLLTFNDRSSLTLRVQDLAENVMQMQGHKSNENGKVFATWISAVFPF